MLGSLALTLTLTLTRDHRPLGFFDLYLPKSPCISLHLPGITDPLGFFDPAGFTEGASEGKVSLI